MPEDEDTIINQCLDGDDDQYSVLVDRYKDMAYNIAFRMLGDADVAKDMAQESFIAAYNALREFRFGSKFSSWLYRITVNKCRDHLRARKETVSVDAIREITPAGDRTPEQVASSRQTGDAIQQALNGLPPEYREVIVLKHIEELDYREIAEILGGEVNTLKVRAHRGREMLKKLLEGTGVTQ
jgi:RNA polymerase sigma-70 factor (ECF subfamily)